MSPDHSSFHPGDFGHEHERHGVLQYWLAFAVRCLLGIIASHVDHLVHLLVLCLVYLVYSVQPELWCAVLLGFCDSPAVNPFSIWCNTSMWCSSCAFLCFCFCTVLAHALYLRVVLALCSCFHVVLALCSCFHVVLALCSCFHVMPAY